MRVTDSASPVENDYRYRYFEARAVAISDKEAIGQHFEIT